MLLKFCSLTSHSDTSIKGNKMLRVCIIFETHSRYIFSTHLLIFEEFKQLLYLYFLKVTCENHFWCDMMPNDFLIPSNATNKLFNYYWWYSRSAVVFLKLTNESYGKGDQITSCLLMRRMRRNYSSLLTSAHILLTAH